MDSKERSCDCDSCAMDQSELTDENLMCSKSCYPESEFEELFDKLRTCTGPGIFVMTIIMKFEDRSNGLMPIPS